MTDERRDDRTADDGDELAELLAEVRRIDVQSHRLVNAVMAGGYNSVFRGSGLEFDSVREYEEGDDPRNVDWNVTARMGRPFVKTYVDERELTVVFVLDLSASMAGGFGVWSLRQMAARVCACLGLVATKNDDKVGLIAFSEDVDRYVPPKKGAGHVLRIVRDCLAVPRGSDQTALTPALEFASRVLRRHAVVFVVSDFLAEDDWSDALNLCARRHDVIAVRMLPPELAGAARGLVRVRDAEAHRSRVIDWGSRRVRDAYAANVEAWQRQTTDRLERARVDVMEMPLPRERDADAIARPIMRFFRMRELRGAKR